MTTQKCNIGTIQKAMRIFRAVADDALCGSVNTSERIA